MQFESIILRFRDLVTGNGGTIDAHKQTIDEKGHVWWGWWKKGNEQTPYVEFLELKEAVEKEPKYFYLIDSGQRKVYAAKCSGIECSKCVDKKSPELENTPNYYNEQKYYAWFCFDEIDECAHEKLKEYTYVQVDSLFVGDVPNYGKFYGKRIYDIDELIQQNRTVWFVRRYNDKTDSNYEIKLLNSNVVEPYNFSKKYYETGSDTLLWLSDLHFGQENGFKLKVESATDITLTKHIQNTYENFDELGGLIITGDITSLGKTEGFEDAKYFLKDINRNLKRPWSSENIVVCPGNHDFKRKEINLGDGEPEKVWANQDSVEAYKNFYKSIYNINPNEYFSCGRKWLMRSGRTVEIVALNSLILQQYKDFQGHGFISSEQLEYVAKEMGWTPCTPTNSIRIVIMHHHYLPTCLVEKVQVTHPSSVVYDAERLMQWLVKYNIKVLLHGHKHQSFIAKIGHFDNKCPKINMDDMKYVYTIGMGGTGAENCDNKFATLTLKSDEIELNYYRIYADNIKEGECVQTINIPL